MRMSDHRHGDRLAGSFVSVRIVVTHWSVTQLLSTRHLFQSSTDFASQNPLSCSLLFQQICLLHVDFRDSTYLYANWSDLLKPLPALSLLSYLTRLYIRGFVRPGRLQLLCPTSDHRFESMSWQASHASNASHWDTSSQCLISPSAGYRLRIRGFSVHG